jgi:hypothetical protein
MTTLNIILNGLVCVVMANLCFLTGCLAFQAFDETRERRAKKQAK